MTENKHPEVHVKCRRGSDPTTHGSECDSLSAFQLSPRGASYVSFKCKKCGYQWNLAVGGACNI